MLVVRCTGVHRAGSGVCEGVECRSGVSGGGDGVGQPGHGQAAWIAGMLVLVVGCWLVVTLTRTVDRIRGSWVTGHV